ncbi:RDD family protein [Xanthomonas sp. 3058]|uniref:RDD family protein n=1 Tax=Xanthomonas sp. 3058 TaxID=3035314 RepID=UPI0016122D77|nr:RDD family protein [Xanthomonas sp. 3058]MBB5866346.1 putative RDD family membrane protein YckC [Xanthomonas sp. 3058]
MTHQDMEYVGFWPRVGAAIIDGLLFCLITLPLLTLIYGESYWTSDSFIEGPADVIVSWVLPAIISCWLWVVRGQTPGKMVFGARIVNARTGENITLGRAIVRYLAYFISTAAFFIGCLWVSFDPRKQGWHDHIAGTVVVKKKRREASAAPFER